MATFNDLTRSGRPLSSVAHLKIPQPAAHHKTLLLAGSATTPAQLLWSDGKIMSETALPAGVSGVERMEDGSFSVAVGSGSYALVLA